MLSSLVCFFSLLLILTGLFFIFYLVFAKIISEEYDSFFIVVHGYEGDKNLINNVYSAYIQINMMNFSEKRPVHIIDYGLSDKTKEAISQAIGEPGKVIFLTIEENCLHRQ